MINWISKKYKDTKLLKKNVTFDDFIDVFEDKINGWYLNWANSATQKRHAGFIALHIGFSYFEAISIFKNGKAVSSSQDFKNGLKDIFQSDFNKTGVDSTKILKLLYEEGRCGFFHSGMARKGILLEDGQPTIRIKSSDIDKDGKVFRVRIDRHTFIERIRNDFTTYINNLRDPLNKQLRDNFKKSWNNVHIIQNNCP
jgi:hypothetical protein